MEDRLTKALTALKVCQNYFEKLVKQEIKEFAMSDYLHEVITEIEGEPDAKQE